MTAQPPTPPENHRDLPRFAEDVLRAGGGTPDLTGRIMGRLGYMHAAPAVIKRDRRRRWLHRVSVAIGSIAIVTCAVFLHQGSEQARWPAPVTLPAAIGNDLNRQQGEFNRLIRTIRRLTPAPASDTPAAGDGNDNSNGLEDAVDRSAVAPVRWV